MSNKIIIGVVGTRKWDDWGRFSEVIEAIVEEFELLAYDIEFVSGGASSGADSLIRDWAEQEHYELKEHRPQYELYGRYEAPKRRNTLIVDDCDLLVAFWNGRSRGTKDSIDKAKAKGKEVRIIPIRI